MSDQGHKHAGEGTHPLAGFEKTIPSPIGIYGPDPRDLALVHARLFKDPKDGPRIGRYRLLQRIGQGGMGIVYKARDDELERTVALKLVVADRQNDPTALRRLRREAKAMAQLSHSSVVRVFDVGEDGEQIYVAMEYVSGQNLERWLERRRLGKDPRIESRWDEILEVFLQAGEGLAAAHEAGIVHRDFKPANVIIGDDGGVRVLDFGLARALIDPSQEQAQTEAHGLFTTSLTAKGTLIGTPAYMSPEQLSGGATDARSDIFSFCVALFEALYDARPYAGTNLAELATSVLLGPPPTTPETLVPSAIGDVVLRGMARDPSQRWPSVRGLIEKLHAERRNAQQALVRMNESDSAPHKELTFAGRYRVLSKLGEGGMGEVYLAEHTRLGRKVAIKIIARKLSASREQRVRFDREARAASMLQHPNVVDITDFGETDDGRPFYVMEYLEGEDLATHLKRLGPMSWPRARSIMRQILKALEKAHSNGIIHRDLKPQNCFCVGNDEGESHVKLLDFGIAKLVSDEATAKTLTEAGSLLGTPHYMSPEQAKCEPIDARSDLYSAGIVLFQCLTGSAPFAGNHSLGVLANVLSTETPRPSEVYLKGDIPEFVDEIVLKATAKRPIERFQSANEFLVAIEQERTGSRFGRGTVMIAATLTTLAISVVGVWQLSSASSRSSADAVVDAQRIETTALKEPGSQPLRQQDPKSTVKSVESVPPESQQHERPDEKGEPVAKPEPPAEPPVETSSEKPKPPPLKPYLTKRDKSRGIGRIQGKIDACKRHGWLAGIVATADIKVDASGGVDAVTIHKPIGATNLGTCLKLVVEKTRFPKTKNGDEFTYEIKPSS